MTPAHYTRPSVFDLKAIKTRKTLVLTIIHFLIFQFFYMTNEIKKQQKAELALQIINQAKDELTYFNYRRFLVNNYRINSMLTEFKKDFVFSSKEYLANYSLYKKGVISLGKLKAISDELLQHQLKECALEEIDYFFEIKR